MARELLKQLYVTKAVAKLMTVQGYILGIHAGGSVRIKTSVSGSTLVVHAGVAGVGAKTDGGKNLSAAVGVNAVEAGIAALTQSRKEGKAQRPMLAWW